jgi:two-component system sensor histidine kinase HydH
LRTKLVLLCVLLVLVPGVIFGVIAISSGRRSLTEAVGRQLGEEARNAADRLSAQLEERRVGLVTVARQDLMREVRIGDLDKRVASLLSSAQQGDPSCLGLIATDTRGRAIAASDASLLEEGFVPTTAANEGIEGPFSWRRHGRAAFAMWVPIPNPDRTEEMSGRLIGLFDWEREMALLGGLRSNLRSAGLDVDVLLLDAQGLVIAGAFHHRSPRAVGVNLLTEGWASARLQGAGFDTEPGAHALVGHAPIAGPPWRIFVVESIHDALHPVHSMTIQLALALAAVLLSAVGWAALLGSRVTQPLRELTRAARELAQRKRTMPVVHTRLRGEVGELAEAFNQMTVDLRRAESQLLEAEKFALVGEVAAGVAHEVRTTLGVLRSSAQLLQPQVESEGGEAAELVQIMLDEVERLDSVVAGLLSRGRPRPLVLEPLRLSAPVFRAVDFAAPKARSKEVTIAKVPVEEEPLVLCDDEQMYEVALNLLINAIEVLPPGGTIVVTMHGCGNGHAGFDVRDDGPGIAAEIRDQIFRPFFTQRPGGTGLGLSFVQRVLHEHRGSISVETATGRGSVFRVSLPVAEEPLS